MKLASFAVAAALSILAVGQALAATETFDSSLVIGPTKAAGVWFTDRYAPGTFAAPVVFDGDNRLQVTISAADGASSRPGYLSAPFYNTQGRTHDFGPGIQRMSIDLYVPEDWALTDRRMAGFWGVAYSGLNITDYPEFEFVSLGGTARFRGWDTYNGGFIDMGLPTGFTFNSWQRLSITLAAGRFTYSVGNLSTTVQGDDTDPLIGGATSIGSTILQAHNTTAGVSYSVYWDNLTSLGAVPEPATWAMLILGFGTVGLVLRQTTRRSARTH